MLTGMGGGFCLKNGLNGSGGYIGFGAEGFFSSISDWFSDLFVPSLLSRHQLASRLDCWVSLVSFSTGRVGAFLFLRVLGFLSNSFTPSDEL